MTMDKLNTKKFLILLSLLILFLVVQTSSVSALFNDSLIGYWSFDTGGVVSDLGNQSWSFTSAVWVSDNRNCKVGNCANLYRANSTATSNNLPANVLNSTAGTIMFWLREENATSPLAQTNIFTKNTAGFRQQQGGTTGNNYFQSNGNLTYFYGINQTALQLMVYTWNSTERAVWVGNAAGLSRMNYSSGTFTAPTTTAIYFGVNGINTNERLNGSIDELYLFARVLNSTEIDCAYNSFQGNNYANIESCVALQTRVRSARIAPQPLYTNTSAQGYCNVTDTFLSAVNVSFVWYKNGVSILNGTVFNVTVGTETLLSTLSNTNFITYNNLIFSCNATGSNVSLPVNSSQVRVQNVPLIPNSFNSGLIGYWSFDINPIETDYGNQSWNFSNAVWIVGNSSCRIGNCANLYSANSTATSNNLPANILNVTAGTIMFWIREDNVTSPIAQTNLFRKNSGAFGAQMPGTVNVGVYSSNGNSTTFYSINQTALQLMIYTWNSTERAIWLGNVTNLSLLNYSSGVNFTAPTTTQIYFGVNGVNLNERLNGSLDELYLFGRVLNYTEMNCTYNGYLGGSFAQVEACAVPNIITSCRNINSSGTYSLQTSLTNCAMNITASNVTLEGNGYITNSTFNTTLFNGVIQFINVTNVTIKNLIAGYTATVGNYYAAFNNINSSVLYQNVSVYGTIPFQMAGIGGNSTTNFTGTRIIGGVDTFVSQGVVTNVSLYVSNTYIDQLDGDGNGWVFYFDGSASFINNTFNVSANSSYDASDILGTPVFDGNLYLTYGSTGFSNTCVDSNFDGICDSSYEVSPSNMPGVFDVSPRAFVVGQNAPPILMVNSTITPVVIYSNTTLLGYCQANQASGHNITYDYKWYENNTLKSNGTDGTVLQGVLVNVNNNTMYHVPGTNWTLTCHGTDGYLNSSYLNSTGVYINNTAPVTVSSRISPTVAYVNTSNLTGYCNATDIDNQSQNLTYNYMWYKGNTYVEDTPLLSYSYSSLGVFGPEALACTRENNSLGNARITGYVLAMQTYVCEPNPASHCGGQMELWMGNTTQPIIRYVTQTPFDNFGVPGALWRTFSGNTSINVNNEYVWYCYNATGQPAQMNLFYELIYVPGSEFRAFPNDVPRRINGSVTYVTNESIIYSGTYNTPSIPGNETQVSTLTQGNYTHYDSITFQCQAIDSMNGTGTFVNSTSLEISDLAPVQQTSRITPIAPYTNDTILGYCNATDTDNDTVTYTYTWYKNGLQNLTGNYGPTTSGVESNINNLTPFYTARGQTWILQCLANDGNLSSGAQNSTGVTIQNIATVIQQSTISPTTAYSYTNLSGFCNATDFDGDSLNYTYQWWQNTTLKSSGVAGPFTQGILSNVNNNTGYKTPGTNWTLTCTGTDGVNNTAVMNSTEVYINNTAPVTVSSRISPTTAYVNTSSLAGYCNATDVDNQSQNLTYSYVWYKNGANIISGSYNTPSLPDTEVQLSTLAEGNYTHYDNITFQCTPIDPMGGIGAPTNSTVLTITDLAPVQQTSRILPVLAYANTTLLGYCNATDTDNDNLGYNYTWYLNGVLNTVSSLRQGVCYQETANVTTSCGGLDTGTYTTVNSPWNPSVTNIIDGNYSTSAQYTTIVSSLLINYTVPSYNDIVTSVWQVKDGLGTVNLSLGTCVPIDNTLQLSVSSIFTFNQVLWQCWTGASFTTLRTATPTVVVYEEAVYWNITTIPQGVETLVATKKGLVSGQNWTLQCTAYDGTLYSSAQNSSQTTIQNTVPTMYNASILPQIAYSNSSMTGYCGATDNDGDTVRYYYEWWNNTALQASGVSGYFTQGTVQAINTEALYNNVNSTWYFRCTPNDGVGNGTQLISSGVLIQDQPPQVVSARITPTFAYTNTTLLGYCNATHPDNTTFNEPWEWRRNNVTVASGEYINATNGETQLSNYTLTNVDWDTNFQFACAGYDIYGASPGYVNSSDKYINDLITFGNGTSNANSTFPQIGETVTLTGNVTSRNSVDVCKLAVKDTGIWRYPTDAVNTIIVNVTPTSMSLPFTFIVTSASTTTNNNVTWRVDCNDTPNTLFLSNTSVFTVRDITSPNTTPIQTGTNFNLTSGLSILSRDRYNLTFSTNFFDYNLFAAEINISCDDDGQIYYWTQVNINVTNLTKTDVVDLSSKSMQHCTYFTASSDSHTTQEIPEYDSVELDTGLSFHTENDNLVQVLSDETPAIVDSVNTQKLKDRQTFEFTFTDEKNVRIFTLKSDKYLYYFPDSPYPAHFVVYNPVIHGGNWIDFTDKLNLGDLYKVEKINNYEYKITITTLVPKDTLEFASIGGTLITNFSAGFYIGGTIYIDDVNTYDNASFPGYTFNLQNYNSTPGLNLTGYVSPGSTAIIENVSEGTYWLNFTHPTFYPVSSLVTLNNNSIYVNYTSNQSTLVIIFENIASLVAIPNVNWSLINQVTGFTMSGNTGNVSPLMLNVNATNYTLYWNASGYYSGNQTVTTTALTTSTYHIGMSFPATFNLYDERLSASSTIDMVFNISGATRVSFLVFCPGQTIATVINTTNFTTPITCDYDLLKFQLDYGTTSYYRNFLLSPDEVNSYKIYLIDMTTTTPIYNSLVADDLLNKYINPKIYVLRTIGNRTVQITANVVDIEQKIGAYLVENAQYIVEIHSDNLPTIILGTYAADSTGTKNIRLYEVSMFDSEAVDNNPYNYAIATSNVTGSLLALGRYKDGVNQTTSVTYAIYQDGNAVPLLTTTVSGAAAQDIQSIYNISMFNSTPGTLYGQLDIIRIGSAPITLREVVREDTTIPLGIDLDPAIIHWFLIILLGVIAIMATIQTANYVAIALIGFAALFVIFGWLTISVSVLAIASLVAIISLLKEGERNS